MNRFLLAAGGLAALAGAYFAWSSGKDHDAKATLAAVRTWDYQLQKLDTERLARSGADLLVVDYSRNGRQEGALSTGEIKHLKRRPDGSRRLVVAYLSIGEAEDYRFYWRQSWKSEQPAWLLAENCRWPGNHLVKFWEDDWKRIMFRDPQSYLARIVQAGFDGVYLDRIDAYWDLRDSFPAGKAEMARFVVELAAEARSLDPDFLIIAQNAEAMLIDAPYRRAIDAIAKEDLLNGLRGTGVRNDAQLVQWSISHLQMLAAERKPVFAVEYLTTADAVAQAGRELVGLGFIPTFPTRALDGRDPIAVAATKGPPVVLTGTPEFHARNCKPAKETPS